MTKGGSGEQRRISRSHPLVGLIRSLSRSPEERARAGAFVAEGILLAREALAEGVPIRDALVSPRLERDPRGASLLASLMEAGVRVHRADDALLGALHDAGTHQGILLVVERPSDSGSHLIASGDPDPLVLASFGVQDPGNLGALVRLADASGASGLLAAAGADPFGPKAARASAGSIFRLPVHRVEDPRDALELIGRMRDRGLALAGATPRGGIDYRRADLSGPLALVVGAEGAGLPEEVEARLDVRLTIPMRAPVESINVAAAAAVLLFSAARGRVTTPRALRPRASSPPPAPSRRPAPSRGRARGGRPPR